MAKEETPIVASVIDILTRVGVWAWRLNSGSVPTRGGWFHGAPNGTPDVVGVLDGGRFFGIEVKTAKGKLREAQLQWQERATKAGVLFGVARSGADALGLVRRWQKENDV